MHLDVSDANTLSPSISNADAIAAWKKFVEESKKRGRDDGVAAIEREAAQKIPTVTETERDRSLRANKDL